MSRLVPLLAAALVSAAPAARAGDLQGLARAQVASSATVQPVSYRNWPERPVRLIVPFSTATTSFFLATVVGERLQDRFNQRFVVDSRPGAGGLIGSTLLAGAVPDGQTLAVIGPPHIVSALLQPSLPYDPVKSVAPIAEIATMPNALVASPQLAVKDAREFVALARARPGAFNFSSGGVGSSAHLAAELFNRAGGIRAEHVPYKLTSDAYSAILAGHVHYFVYVLPTVTGLMRDGRLRPLAVTASRRHPALPDVPTVAEIGLPEAAYETWFGAVAPAGAPQPIVTRLNQAISALLVDPKVREILERQGAQPASDPRPEALLQRLRSELPRYAALVKQLGLKPE
ncbi:MAG: tripartite tricarboxylate transporter substrate-binding protein [Pseudomonadota bacterium]